MIIIIMIVVGLILMIAGFVGFAHDHGPTWLCILFIVAGIILMIGFLSYGVIKASEMEKTEGKEAYEYAIQNDIPTYLDGELVKIETVCIDFYEWKFNENKTVLFLTRKNKGSNARVAVPIIIH